MKFRECRLILLNNIFKELKKDISYEETFLILGGIKMSTYVINIKNSNLFFPSGIKENDSIEICKNFNFSYEYITISDFLQQYKKENNLFEDFFFTLSASSTLLNERYIDNIEKNMLGQSEFLIDSIDVSNNKINLLFETSMSDSYWIDISILKKMENIKSWTSQSNIQILKIEKKSIKNSNKLKLKLNTTKRSLLLENLKDYSISNTTEYGGFLKRVEGPQSFLYLINIFSKFKEELANEKNDLKTRYILVVVTYFNNFIIAGTDGFYRNEFVSTLNDTFGDHNNSKIEINKKKWKLVSNEWRQFGRILNNMIKGKDMVNTLNYIIDFLMNIQKKEADLVVELIALLEENESFIKTH